MSLLDDLVQNATEAAEFINGLRNYVGVSSDDIGKFIPNGTTAIREKCFYYATKSFPTIPNSVTVIESGAFIYYGYLGVSLYKQFDATIPGSVITVGNSAFAYSGIRDIAFENGVKYLGSNIFTSCPKLRKISLPNTILSIGSYWLQQSTSLEEVVLENGFNYNGLNISVSTRFTTDVLVAMLNALADRTGQAAYTLIIGTTNINKLTAEQIAIATNKNWNLA